MSNALRKSNPLSAGVCTHGVSMAENCIACEKVFAAQPSGVTDMPVCRVCRAPAPLGRCADNGRTAWPPAGQPSGVTAPPEALQVTDAMVDAYLTEQRRTVEEADKFGRPNAGGLHTNTVREACRNGITAALAASPAPQPKSVAPQAPEGEKIARLYHDAWGNTYAHWLGKPDAEFADFVYTHPAKPGDSGRNRGEVVAPTTKSPATH